MSSSTARPFVEACLAGEALDRDVDDWVDSWSDSGGAPDGAPISLPDHLGMSEREYSLWVEESATLRVIIAARRRGQDVDALLRSGSHFDLAARSGVDGDAVRSLVVWLVDRGDLPREALAEFPS
jgi:hypothetical protein